MKKVLISLAVCLVMVAGPVAATATAATDSQMKGALLTVAEMVSVTGYDYPLVPDAFSCTTENGVRGCGRSVKAPKGSGRVPAGTVMPWMSGVSVAKSPAAALSYLAKSKAGMSQAEALVLESSMPTALFVTMDLMGEGYLGSGQQVVGNRIVSANCSSYKSSRPSVLQCVRVLLAAQVRKTAGLR